MFPTPIKVRGVVPVPARSNVLPAPRISDALVLLRPTLKIGVRTVVVPPAAVVSWMLLAIAGSFAGLSWLRVPPESPMRNDVAAVIALFAGNCTFAPVIPPEFAVTPTLIVLKFAVNDPAAVALK